MSETETPQAHPSMPTTPPAGTEDGAVRAAHADPRRHAAHHLLSRGTRLAWQHDGHSLNLHAGTGQKHAAALPCVCLEHGPTRLLVAIEHETGTPAGTDGHWRDHEGDARLLAWTLANQTLLDTLAELFANPVLATASRPCGGDDALWLALDFKAADGQHLEGWLGIGEAEARRLAEHEDWQNDSTHLPLLGDADTLALELWLPGPLLSAVECAAVSVGDVLLLDTAGGPLAELRPAAGATDTVLGLPDSWTVRHDQGDWVLTERDLLQARGENDRTRMCLTGLEMDLAHLARLEPGAVMAHEALLPGRTVTITRHDDRLRADGTLVALGDRLGVYIVQLEGEHGFQ